MLKRRSLCKTMIYVGKILKLDILANKVFLLKDFKIVNPVLMNN